MEIKAVDVLDSKGLKRTIAGLIAMLMELAKTVTFLTPIVPILEWLAGFFGVVGLSHATVRKTIGIAKIAGIASILAMLILVAQFVPQLQPWIPLLQKLAGLFGAAGAGIAIGKATTS